MPNGDQAPIISIGNLPLSPIICLKNVFGVPSVINLGADKPEEKLTLFALGAADWDAPLPA